MMSAFRIILVAVLLPFLSVAQCVSIINLPDTIPTCKNTSVQLNPSVVTTGSILLTQDTTWTPAAGLSNANIINPVASIGVTSAQYKLTIKALTATNFVNNGDFSQGNTGFTTSYLYGNGGSFGLLSNEGRYAVAANPSSTHTNFASFFDHTVGNATGSMMVINGAAAANVSIWCQTITVLPNTDYDFSAWGASCVGSSPAILQFAINGTLLGTPLTLPTTVGLWTQFHALWNSGSNTTITICITDQQTATSGNDFAIDDIAFRQVCYTEDSVYIKVTNLQPNIGANLKKGCAQDTVDFTFVNNGGDVPTQYKWEFGDGGAAVTANASHIYTTQGSYNVKLVTTRNGCADSATVTVNTVHPISATIAADKDTVCLGTAVQFTQTDVNSSTPVYFWDFGDGTTDNTANPPAHIYAAPGVYNVVHVITDAVPCSDTAFKTVVVIPTPIVITSITDSIICAGKATHLASFVTPGYADMTWDFGDGYFIQDWDTLQHAYEQGGNYNVTLTVNYPLCPTFIQTHTVQVLDNPIVNITGDSILCPYSEPIALFNLNEQSGLSYLWSDGSTGQSIQADKIGIYWLQGVNSEGCTAADSMEVKKACYLDIPNVFTPDADGLNDYFFPRDLLSSKVVKFSMQIVNRWGEKVFETSSTNGRGWDGKFNGKDQPSGVYIYLIQATIQGMGPKKYQGNLTLMR